MSVLVTGGAGYIGSHMTLALADRGEEVVVLDNLSTGVETNVDARSELVVGDAGDHELVCRLIDTHGIDAIVHFAGSIVVPDSIADPLGYYLNNTVKTRALIQAAVDKGLKAFIFSSTAAVYGIPAENPIAETVPLAPISPYGASKMMTEMMLRDTGVAHPLRHVALRYFNVAGADPEGRSGQSTPRATHLIKVASQAALGQRPHLDVFGTDYETPDGTCIRDYIHVSDLIGAHVLALDYLRRGGDSRTMNCGYGTGYSVMEVIDAVKRVSGTEFAVKLCPRRAGDPPALVSRAEAVRSTLGWTPQYADLDLIVRHALNWENKLQSSGAAA
ncbi:UDP-glucose 4-epimerase GalE [Tepidamorphus sp. 3E244]|uniref:UDP-glucose 4-epimerase GalE n=1 Tax=Tepidamorphus sp. 3E244 TaxID=3385498 RepID=UPI0038FCFF23